MAISWAYGLAAPSPCAGASSGIASPLSSASRSDVRPVSRRCRILQYMLLLPACDSVQRPSASPRHILDTVWLRRHSEDVKLVSFFSPVVIPRLQKQRGERANQHSGLPRLSRDRDKSRERGVDRSTRGLTQNVSLGRIDGLCRTVVVAL